MAVKIWVGTTNSTWSTDSNWQDSSGGATTAPADTDDVYITSGSVNIDGMDASATQLNSLTVGSKYTGPIGSSTTVLKIDATTVNFSGLGDTYLDGTYTTFTVMDTGSTSTALTIKDSTITTLRLLGGSGTVTVSGSTLNTTIEQIGADAVTTSIAADNTIGGSCALTIDSGTMELKDAIPTITCYGGLLDIELGTGTITTLNQYGGRIRFIPTASCTITTLTVYSGLFDSKDSTASSFTITNSTIHENGTLDERSGLENATYTNPIAIEGGQVRYDTGRTVTIS